MILGKLTNIPAKTKTLATRAVTFDIRPASQNREHNVVVHPTHCICPFYQIFVAFAAYPLYPYAL